MTFDMPVQRVARRGASFSILVAFCGCFYCHVWKHINFDVALHDSSVVFDQKTMCKCKAFI